MERKSFSGLFILGLAAALLLAGCAQRHRTYGPGPFSPRPVLPAELKAEAHRLGQPIYWAGPQKGFHYEFRRTPKGNVYVRYLPTGMGVGATCGRCLVVGTYPFVDAFPELLMKPRTVAGPRGSAYLVSPQQPRSVYVAFPGVEYQIEVYAPSPARALRIARSGSVQPVG